MAIRNRALTINFLAWDTAADAGKTGDAANFTLRLIKDGGAPAAPTNAVSEPDAVNLPGLYELALTADEMDADFIALGGISSTANVVIRPRFIETEQGLLAEAAEGIRHIPKMIGTCYYVDVGGGSDTNTGLSPDQAFVTFKKAVDTVADGDTIFVKSGHYLEFFWSLYANRVKVICEPGTSFSSSIGVGLQVRGDWNYFLNWDYDITGGGSGGTTIEGEHNTFVRCNSYGIGFAFGLGHGETYSADYNTFIDCHHYGNVVQAWQINGSYNRFFRCSARGDGGGWDEGWVLQEYADHNLFVECDAVNESLRSWNVDSQARYNTFIRCSRDQNSFQAVKGHSTNRWVDFREGSFMTPEQSDDRDRSQLYNNLDLLPDADEVKDAVLDEIIDGTKDVKTILKWLLSSMAGKVNVTDDDFAYRDQDNGEDLFTNRRGDTTRTPI